MTVTVDPNFKSSLPPRKRAKTQEEKEQRRVERILRNRRAAHASREKKRKHVEYLEAYVLQLEDNLATLTANLGKTTAAIPPNDLRGLGLAEPADLSKLREHIHSNLSLAVAGSPEKRMKLERYDDDDDEEDNDDRASSDSSDNIKVKPEEVDANLLAAPSSGYFNYLSPVSINSPGTSPIDLSLKKTDSSGYSSAAPNTPELTLNTDGMFVSSAASGIDFMAQNPEVILSPMILMV